MSWKDIKTGRKVGILLIVAVLVLIITSIFGIFSVIGIPIFLILFLIIISTLINRKSWAYWVKGGVMGLVYSLIFIFSDLVLTQTNIKGSIAVIFYYIVHTFVFPFTETIKNMTPWVGYVNTLVLKWIAILIVYLIFGALIGWIYGKIKNRNKQ